MYNRLSLLQRTNEAIEMKETILQFTVETE